jgi:glycosyltransferase involved in cell wall biosynthesis
MRLRESLRLPAGPLVVTVGRIEPEKGIDVLTAAWPSVARRMPGARLCIVGDGSARALLQSAAQDILWIGSVQDVAPYLRAADAFALPSRTEGLPVALLEAMACGLSCTATAVGGTVELVQDGWSGRLVPSERPADLADGIVEALRTPEWGMAARRVAARFSLELVADRFISLYKSVVRARNELPAGAVQ